MVTAIGRQMDDLLASLRALARGIYPSLLTERGLTDALRSAAQLSPAPASFRAATVRNILDFPQQFTPAATIVTLDRNYRSTQPILAAANGVIGLARERFTKNVLRSVRFAGAVQRSA